MEHLVAEHRHLGILCDVCDNQVKYTRYSDFWEHYLGIHGHCPKKYRCEEECGMDFWTRKCKRSHDLQKHTDNGNKKDEKKKETKNRYNCDLCLEDGNGDAAFQSQLELISHKIRAHGTEPFKCDICGKTFKEKGTWSRHIKGHAWVEFKKEWGCEVEGCGKLCNDSKGLKRHRQGWHGGKKKVRELCGKEYSEASALGSHIDSVHLGLRPRVCEECGESFTSGTVLKTNKLIHTGEQPFGCEICGQRFRHKEVLRRHFVGHEEKGKDFKTNGPMKQLRKRKAN